MRFTFLLLILVAAALGDHEQCDCGILEAQMYCSGLFRQLDTDFSKSIRSKNITSADFLAAFPDIFTIIPPDFVYTINGRVITGEEAIFEAVLQMQVQYIIRETHPPVADIYPKGMYSSQHGVQLARLHSRVFHTFTNSTGTFMDFNDHFFYCQKVHQGNWMMINATLSRYALIRS